MISILYWLASIATLVCFIIMVIPLFKEKGALHGILGIICMLYTYIWGWMNAGRLGKKNIMIIWTIALIACMVLGGMGAVPAMQGAGVGAEG